MEEVGVVEFEKTTPLGTVFGEHEVVVEESAGPVEAGVLFVMTSETRAAKNKSTGTKANSVGIKGKGQGDCSAT